MIGPALETSGDRGQGYAGRVTKARLAGEHGKIREQDCWAADTGEQIGLQHAQYVQVELWLVDKAQPVELRRCGAARPPENLVCDRYRLVDPNLAHRRAMRRDVPRRSLMPGRIPSRPEAGLELFYLHLQRSIVELSEPLPE